MPRQAREKSESGYYHILLRGIGQQNIFEEQEDREKFLQILEKYKKGVCQGDGSLVNSSFIQIK